MRCPHCKGDDSTRVINVVHRLDGSVRRRHGCDTCAIRWTSYENLVPASITAEGLSPYQGSPK
jgi:transcriptional regulator NrdR family protein